MSDRVYFTKPKEIEALQYTGDNFKEVKEFVTTGLTYGGVTDEFRVFIGDTEVVVGDVIVKNNYHYYPIAPHIFNKLHFYIEQPSAMHLPAIRREPNFKTYEELMNARG